MNDELSVAPHRLPALRAFWVQQEQRTRLERCREWREAWVNRWEVELQERNDPLALWLRQRKGMW